MVIPEKLKLNRFKLTVIPRPRAYFSRFGSVSPVSSRYSGDESLPIIQSKIDSIVDIQRQIDEIQAKFRDEGEI